MIVEQQLAQLAPSQEEVETICSKLAGRITALIEGQGHDEAPLEDSLDVALSQALEAPLPRQTCITDETDEPSEPPPHAAIVTGEGEAFCAGHDIRRDNPTTAAFLEAIRSGKRPATFKDPVG